MSKLLRGVAAGYGARKMTGGCGCTGIIVFIILWWHPRPLRNLPVASLQRLCYLCVSAISASLLPAVSTFMIDLIPPRRLKSPTTLIHLGTDRSDKIVDECGSPPAHKKFRRCGSSTDRA